MTCGKSLEIEFTEFLADPRAAAFAAFRAHYPRCAECAGIVKGDTVQFGEPIPPDVLRGCYGAVEACDCMLVAGTSATVYPAAEFPMEVLRRGGTVIEVNPHPSELTPLASFSLRGPGGAVLERLLHWSLRARDDGAAS